MRNKLIYIALSTALVGANAQGIVIRHDVNDEKYAASIKDFPPLATLYAIGVHGTLIDPQWVVTAGHAIFCMEPGDKIKVGYQWAEIEGRFTHANYELDEDNDIALLKLKTPITNIKPAKLYRDSKETGKNIWFIGSGGTGTGKTGQTVSYKENNGKLRKAENKIERVSDSEIFFVFDKGDEALPLEGVSGNADSGGPAYQQHGDEYYLYGISSRSDSFFKDIGEYGVDEVYSRVSYHAQWIDNVVAGDKQTIENHTTQYHFAQDGIKNNLAKACDMIGFK